MFFFLGIFLIIGGFAFFGIVLPRIIDKELQKGREAKRQHQLQMKISQFKYQHRIPPTYWSQNDDIINRLNNPNNLGINIGGAYFFNEPGHILTIGGSRSGKGSCLIVPALLDENFAASGTSLVVLDPKGENLNITGHYLQSQGYEVHCINPFNIRAVARFGKSTFNPLSYSDVIDEQRLCDLLATAMLPPTDGKNEHFQSSANQYISNYLLHMVTKYPDDVSFDKFYSWVRYGGDRRIQLLGEMAGNEKAKSVRQNAAAIADQLIETKAEEINSIYSTMRRGTEFLKNDAISSTLSGNDIDLRKLSKRKMAIFLCMEPTDLADYQEFVRVFFAIVMAVLPKVTDTKRKVLLLMDEFAQMGRLREFEVGFDTLAGYNVTIWAIIQQLGQLKDLYKERYEGFLASSVVKQYIGIGDLTTAEYIKKSLPEETLVWLGERQEIQHKTKPLLHESEIMKFDSILAQIRGLDYPAKLGKNPYYKIPYYIEKSEIRVSELLFDRKDMLFDDYKWTKEGEYNFLTKINRSTLRIVDKNVGNHVLWFINSLIYTYGWENVSITEYQKLEQIIREQVPSNIYAASQMEDWIAAYTKANKNEKLQN